MKTRIPRRIFSLLLVIVLLISSMPSAFATSFAEAKVRVTVTISVPESTELTVGDTLQLEAAVDPADMAGELVWTTGDESVATVDETGLVTALSAGEVEIQAVVGEVSDLLLLTVTAPLPPVETVPAETVPEETVSEETAPEETVPEETIPDETVPEETVPEETVSEDVDFEETVPVESGPAMFVPDVTVPEETIPEETVPEETIPEETVPEETIPEETVPEEVTYDLPGMPEGYVLSEADLSDKAAMREHDVLNTLSTLTAGEDYVADQIMFSADSEEEAAAIAAAYNAELVEFEYGIGVANLTTVTVAEAMDACLTEELNLPVVSPNGLTKREPVEGYELGMTLSSELPEEMTWYSWVKENNVNDPLLQTPTSSEYQWMHDAVDTYSAWGVTTGASWVKVAVIDTGVYKDHKDLAGRVTPIDVGCGSTDVDGHGTHVAGIIAGAMGNGVAGAGIAPGVSIISICVQNSEGTMADAHIIRAINAAVANGAHIINMSLGGPVYNPEEQKAITNAVNADVTVIAAMGNEGSNTMAFPAAYDGVIAVAATDKSNDRANFSNYGSWADISAPGHNIYSSYLGSTTKYYSANGTSQATPVVAGVAALYTSAMGKRIDPAAMEKALKASATKLSDSGMGAGLVNAANMLDDKPAAPSYRIIDSNGNFYSAKDTIPCDATLYMRESEAAFDYGVDGDTGSVFIYTINGKTPSAKNGEVINGSIVKDPCMLSLSSFAGTTVTVKLARVSGMGMVGKVLTLKLKVARTAAPTSVSIQGSATLIPGKSCTYTASVYPLATADQTVTWSIVKTESTSGDLSKAKINAKTGKLTTPAKATGTITIKATTTKIAEKSATFKVTVENINPVSKMALNVKTAEVWVDGTYQLSVSSMTDKYGAIISPSTSGVKWTSSNPKILTVTSAGKVTGVSAGKATVTCAALDGSGKTAKCTVTVKQQILGISISGQDSIAPGATAKYKITYIPSNATNKTISWSLENAPRGVRIDAKTGTVTVDKSTSFDQVFTVVATEKDGYGSNLTVKWPVDICSKASKIKIRTVSYSGRAPGAAKDKSGFVKSITLFSHDLAQSSGKDNQISLGATVWIPKNGSPGYCEFTSSNTSVATVTPGGVVTAHKAGTTKITCKATDGSNKSTSVTLKVTNPVSSISINSSTQRMLTSTPIIACGTSAKNTAVFADTFGEPSNKKVTWSYSVYENNTNKTSTYKKYISLSSSDTLSIKSSLKSTVDKLADKGVSLYVRVTATAADNTGISSTITYIITRKTEKMVAGTCTEVGDLWLFTFYTDQYYSVFNATSSNSKVASLYELDGTSIECFGYDSYLGLYEYGVLFVKPGFTGKAKLTVKAIDGSNKSCSTTVKVD